MGSATEPVPTEGSQKAGHRESLKVALVTAILVACIVGFGFGFLAGWFANDDDDATGPQPVPVPTPTPSPTPNPTPNPTPAPPPAPVPLLLHVEGTVEDSQHIMIQAAVQKAMAERNALANASVSLVCSLSSDDVRTLNSTSFIPTKLRDDASVCQKKSAAARRAAHTENVRITVVEVLLFPWGIGASVSHVIVGGDFAEALEMDLKQRGLVVYILGHARGGCGNGKEMKISTIQGSGSKSDMVGKEATVEGVVVGHGPGGFYVQEEPEDYDGDAKTSEGLFVQGTAPGEGLTVRVTGTVAEHYGLTALGKASYVVCPFWGRKQAPKPVDLDVVAEDLEAKEGMLVKLTTKLVVTDTYEMWMYGSLVLGPRLALQPTDVAAPFSEAYKKQEEANKQGRILVEDVSTSRYPKELPFLVNGTTEGGPVVRVGAEVVGDVVGALGYSYGDYRIVPQKAVELNNKRDEVAKPVVKEGGDLRVGTFNVKNYFNGKRVNGNVTFNFAENRGATTAEAFELQSRKIEAALLGLDADVVGAVELENDGFGEDSAIRELTRRLNGRERNTNKHYRFVSVSGDRVGSDAITCGILYREEKVLPKGEPLVIEMPRQKYTQPSDGKTRVVQMRPALVQTFTDLASGQDFAVVVVHLKSKGSGCWEDEESTKEERDRENSVQGNCNPLRVSAAVALGEALEKAALPERVVLVGDVNTYTHEDPMAVLTTYTPEGRGYVVMSADKVIGAGDAEGEAEGTVQAGNVTKTYGFVNVLAGTPGYTSTYDGKVGSLDHVLVSRALEKDVVGATRWNINAAELYQMDYSQAVKHYPGYVVEGPFRSSDHNPVLVSLRMPSVAEAGSRLTLLHINDHHSHLESKTLTFGVEGLGVEAKDAEGQAVTAVKVPYGGFPRLVTLYEQLEREAAREGQGVLRLHAGDAITGSLYFTLFEGAADAEMMQVVCFDAFALGNHEFDDGDTKLAQFLEGLREGSCQTTAVAANVVPGKSSPLQGLIQPYVVKRVRGAEVGIVGIDIASATKESSFPDPGTEFLAETETAQKYIDELKGKGVERIVVVAHQGFGKDVEMAQALRGADVVVGGHTHSLLGNGTRLQRLGLSLPTGDYPREVVGADGKKVCVVQAWEYANLVGKLEVDFDVAGDVVSCRGGARVPVGKAFEYVHSKGTMKPVEGADAARVLAALQGVGEEVVPTDEDPASLAALRKYEGKIEEQKQRVVGEVAEDLCLDRFPGQFTCANGNTYRHGSDIGMVVAKAFLTVTASADVAIQNGGGVRTSVEAGNFTLADANNVLPFSNTLVTLNLTGEEIKTTLEDALAFPLERDGSTGAYPYAYGLRYTVNASAAQGDRVLNVEVNRRVKGEWAPLDLKATYVVVTNDYIASGKDGYVTFGKVFAERYHNTYTEYMQGFVDYVVAETAAGRKIGPLPVAERSTQRFINTKGCDHSVRTDCEGI